MIEAGLQFIARTLFALVHDIKVQNPERIPDSGAVILAANHPTYLDPGFIMHRIRRPVRFLAWERPFRIPVLGTMMRRFGAIPLDIQNPGRASIEAAVKVLRRGEVFGIFPEGGRSKQDTLNPLKSGVARLAMITGAPIVPVTIRGGRKVWPRHRLFPRPGRIVVQFHDPIQLSDEERSRGPRRKELERDLVDRVMAAINGSLLPAVRAEKRERRLMKTADVPFDPWGEGVNFLFIAAAWLWRWVPVESLSWGLFWSAAFALSAAVSPRVHPKSPETKALRNYAAWLLACFHLWIFLPWSPSAALAAIVVFAVIGGWLQFFRFATYRVFRRWGLPVTYAALAGVLVHG